MADFGKLNFAVAFNPQTAFPLDARYYFDNLTQASAAAASAVAAGSSDGTYYFGEQVVVVEDGIAALYMIQPDGSLSSILTEDEVQSYVTSKITSGSIDLSDYSTTDEVNMLIANAIAAIDFSAYSTTEEIAAAINEAISGIDLSGYVLSSDLSSEIAAYLQENPQGLTEEEVQNLIDAIDIPTTLPSPYSLTITGAATGSYDGSEAVTINIPETDLSSYVTQSELSTILADIATDGTIDLTGYLTEDDVATTDQVNEMLNEIFG